MLLAAFKNYEELSECSDEKFVENLAAWKAKLGIDKATKLDVALDIIEDVCVDMLESDSKEVRAGVSEIQTAMDAINNVLSGSYSIE